MSDSRDFEDRDGAQFPSERVVLIASTADDAQIIRNYLREVPWLEVCTDTEMRAA